MTLQPNILVSISGKAKSGKTHLAMTFPAPIKVYSFDLRAKIIKPKFPDKEIDIHEFLLPMIESTSPEPWATPVWNEFYEEFKKDVSGGQYKTLVLDLATIVEEICRQYVFEEVQRHSVREREKMSPTEYLMRNLLMGNLFTNPRNLGVNLVAIQYVRDEWKKPPGKDKAEPTGEIIPDGWARTEGQVDLILETEAVEVGGKTVFRTTIKANAYDPSINGQYYNNTDYAELMALLGV